MSVSARHCQVGPAKVPLCGQGNLIPLIRPILLIEANLLPLAYTASLIVATVFIHVSKAVSSCLLVEKLAVNDPVFTRSPAQGCTRAVSIAGIDVIFGVFRIVKSPAAAGTKNVVNPTGILGCKTDQAQGQGVLYQWPVNHGTDVVTKITLFNGFTGEIYPSLERARIRFVGNDAQGAALCRIAKQGSLRSAQRLYALNINQPWIRIESGLTDGLFIKIYTRGWVFTKRDGRSRATAHNYVGSTRFAPAK